MEKIKIFVCDNHPVVRYGIRSYLETRENFEIIDEASNGEDAIEKLELVKPDIIILSIHLPKTDGFALTKILLDKYPGLKIIIFTIQDDFKYVRQMLKLGVKGYILKNLPLEDLSKAIESVNAGQIFIHPELNGYLYNDYINKIDFAEKIKKLSPMEKKILNLVIRGYTNGKISEELCISVNTARTHRNRIMEKINIHSALELANLVNGAVYNKDLKPDIKTFNR